MKHAGAGAAAAGEGELLRQLRRGERAAAEQLAEENYRRVYAYLVKLTGDPDRSADLTQDTFRKAWSALGTFDGRSTLSTWLHRIAYTTFLNSIRGPRRLVALPDDPPPIVDPSPAADETLSRGEEERSVRAAVLELPEELRFTVTALYWGEMSVREVAAVEGISTVAVRKRLAKAHKRLASRLTEVHS